MTSRIGTIECRSLTLKYSGTSELNVDVLIKSLQSVSNGLKEISYTDTGLKVDVTVKPFKEGSFEVFFSLMAPLIDGQANLMLNAINCDVIVNKFTHILNVVSYFRGKRLPKPIEQTNGDLLYLSEEEENTNAILVPKEIGNIEEHYSTTLANLDNLLLAAGEAGGESDMLILDEDQEVIAKVSRETITKSVTNITTKRNDELLNDEIEEDTKLDVMSKVIVAIGKPDLVGRSAWKVIYDNRVVTTKVSHEEFLKKINTNKLHVFSRMKMIVDLELKKTFDKNYGAYIIKGYNITHVYELLPDANDNEQQDLFIDEE